MNNVYKVNTVAVLISYNRGLPIAVQSGTAVTFSIFQLAQVKRGFATSE